MPWQKGQSGNPAGRPKKGLSFSDIIRQQGEIVKNGKPTKDLLVEKLYELSMKGDMAALKYLMDRVDGTPRQSMDLGVTNGPAGFDINFTDEGEPTEEV
jgi:hypothetical protein